MSDDDDDNLFLNAIGDGVRPLRSPERAADAAKPKPKPTLRMRDRDESEALREFRLGIDDSVITADETLS